jgi:hypothetical protein
VTYRNGAIDLIAPSDGQITVAQAWFPRWTATANGRPLALSPTDAGAIRTQPVPEGAEVQLRYRIDVVDWIGRVVALLGVVLVVVLALPGRISHLRATGDGTVSS